MVYTKEAFYKIFLEGFLIILLLPATLPEANIHDDPHTRNQHNPHGRKNSTRGISLETKNHRGERMGTEGKTSHSLGASGKWYLTEESSLAKRVFPSRFDASPESTASSSSSSSSSNSFEEWDSSEEEVGAEKVLSHKSKQSLQRKYRFYHYPLATERFPLTSQHRKGSRIKKPRHLSDFPDPPLSLAAVSRGTGPYFESNHTTIHVSAKAGDNVSLDCTVIMLKGRTVSWLRRGDNSLQLLTVGNTTYYHNPRLSLRFRYPDNWRLAINSVQADDQGEYQCQVSTHPVKTLIYHLKIVAPVVTIHDENGHLVTERHYRMDSSLHLTCKAVNADQFDDQVVWMKGDKLLHSGTDNRVKIKITKNEEIDETSIHLTVLWLQKEDSGNYSCKAGTLSKYTVVVHVVNGELPAAVQHESRTSRLSVSFVLTLWSLSMSITKVIAFE